MEPQCLARCTTHPCSAGIFGVLLTRVLLFFFFLSSTFGSSGDSVIGQLFSCEVENCSMCRCGKETVRVSSTLLFTLSYPESAGNPQGWAGLAGFTPLPFPWGRTAKWGGLLSVWVSCGFFLR